MTLEQKLKKYNREIYNDIVVNGEVIVKGARECASRFAAIDAVVPQQGAILDVGCHLGFFTIQLAAQSKQRIVVGMEGNYQRADLAGQIAKENDLDNVIILNNLFSEKIAQRWGNSCEALNSILFLNVLHHCKKAEIEAIIDGAQKLAHQLIIETPHLDETTACGSLQHRQMIEQITIPGYSKDLIADTETHTSDGIKRPMYLFANDNWSKHVLRPHYYHHSPSKHKHRVELKQGRFHHNNTIWDDGVNVGTMMALNMVYPDKERLFDLITTAIEAHDGPLYDVNLWNMIYTPNGIKLIDFSNRLEQKCSKSEALSQLSLQYDEMKKEGAKPLQVQNFKNWVKHIIVGVLGRYKK